MNKKGMQVAVGLLEVELCQGHEDSTLNHQYCTEVLIPLLSMCASRPERVITLSIPGRGLEFIAKNYPQAFEWFRGMVHSGTIELISSLYTPALWIAFPFEDLERSIIKNRRVLADLGLPASRVFSTSGGFWSEGLRQIVGEFDVALCRDEILRHQSGIQDPGPYQLGSLKVIIGANHIAHEIATQYLDTNDPTIVTNLPNIHQRHLEQYIKNAARSSNRCCDQDWSEDHSIHWYHMGYAHQLTCAGGAGGTELLHHDVSWMQRVRAALDQRAASGFKFISIRELSEYEALRSCKPLPLLIESGWNSRASRGVYGWMGMNHQNWAAPNNLALVWRARKALIDCQALCHIPKSEELCVQVDEEMRDLWSLLLSAENHRSFVRFASVQDVAACRDQCIEILNRCAVLKASMRSELPEDHQISDIDGIRVPEPLETELINADGEVSWQRVNGWLWRCEIAARSDADRSGVRFKIDKGDVRYSPSGCDDLCISVSQSAGADFEVALPLANGLLGIGNNRYLIRDNESVSICALLNRNDQWVAFVIDGSSEGRSIDWRFFIVDLPECDALVFANKLNRVHAPQLFQG